MHSPRTPPEPADARTAGLPSVSVIMPILNEERHLREAVAMILAQDYPGPLEVVLALGPSRDRTDEVAADARRRRRPRAHRAQPDRAHARRAQRRHRRRRPARSSSASTATP